MKKLIGLFILVMIQQIGWAQQKTKEELLKDLRFLNEAVSKGHPVNYNSKQLTTLNTVLEKATLEVQDSLGGEEYTKWILEAIFNIGCVHTSIVKNPLTVNARKQIFLPLHIRIENNDLVIRGAADSNHVSQIIKKNNGVSSEELFRYFSKQRASDGATVAFSIEYFNLLCHYLLPQYLNYPTEFNIETTKETFKIKAVSDFHLNENKKEEAEYSIKNGRNTLNFINKTAILELRSFEKSDRTYFQKAFGLIESNKTEQLILDLRQNTGGNRNAAIELTKHLVNNRFGYEILEPKLRTSKYIDTKGLLLFSLSKLKYNVGGFYRGHRTVFGRSFRYFYKPAQTNAFNKQVYVLIDGLTASSATMVCSWLKQFSNAVFIGTLTGGGYNGNNGGSFPTLTLPESKIKIQFPAYRLILDPNSNQSSGIVPDYLLTNNYSVRHLLNLISDGKVKKSEPINPSAF